MRKPKKWPKYLSPDADHMQAIGVLIYCFNSFEETISRITTLQITKNGGAARRARRVYHALSDGNKTEFSRLIFSICEKDESIKNYGLKLLSYFEGCKAIRNDIVHSRFDPPLFLKDGGQPEPKKYLYLNKARSSSAASSLYSKPSTRTLRKYADATSLGLARAIGLHFLLVNRDKPSNTLPPMLRALMNEPLPGIPAPPKLLKKSPRPHMPEIPPHLR
jgi:hypothetical protein